MKIPAADPVQPSISDLDLAIAIEQSVRTVWSLLPEPLQISVIVSLVNELTVASKPALGGRISRFV